MEKEAITQHPKMAVLEPFDKAIGELCREWARLEQAVTHLFLKIGGWDYSLRTAYPMVSCIDIRDQMTAIRVGVLAWGCREDIMELTIQSIDFIENVLRTSRNRLVHDSRMPADDGIGAVSFNGAYTVAKEPSTGKRILRQAYGKYLPLEEVEMLTSDIIEEKAFLFKLYEWFRFPHNEPLGPLLTPPPRQTLRRQREKQSQTDKTRAKQKLPPKSSPP